MPLTEKLPKPMIPIGNQPLMDRTIRLLADQEFRKLITNLYIYPKTISQYFQDGSKWGVELHYSNEEGFLRGTAGGVKKCEFFLDETFVVVSGDALTDVDLKKLTAEHKKKGALATLALKAAANVEKYGVVLTDYNGKVTAFQEKPSNDAALSHRVNTGIYVFEPEILQMIPRDEFYDFGRQLFPLMAEKQAPIYGVDIDEYWCDIGDVEIYKQAHADMLNGLIAHNSQFAVMRQEEGGKLLSGFNNTVEEGVEFRGHVTIGSNCHIAAHAVIENSIIWSGSRIGAHSHITDSVVRSGCSVPDRSEINQTAIL